MAGRPPVAPEPARGSPAPGRVEGWLRGLGGGGGRFGPQSRASWRRATGSAMYLAIVAGMGTVLGPVLTHYLEPPPLVQVTINPSVLANWDGPEGASFQVILDRFRAQHRIAVSYRTARQVPSYLDDALTAGSAPDVAILPQPGELMDLAAQGRLRPLDGIVDQRSLRDMDSVWSRYASRGGRLYGVYFKAADKSVVWYRPDLFRKAGIAAPPTTWDELIADVARLRAAGVTPFAMCGATAWTLTDWFENLYLQTAGRADYEALAAHRGAISWRDPSVARALTLMAEVFAPGNAAGGTPGILGTEYPDCVNLVFSTDSSAAMVMEGDFVLNQVRSLGASMRAGVDGDYDMFPFPTVHPGETPPVVVGGDVAVLLRDSPQARALIAYLATPDAGRIWAGQGGFISPHRDVRSGSYPNAISKALAARVTGPTAQLVFDMSDQAPAKFGSTVRQGEWGALQQWLVGPSPGSPEAISAVQEQLEASALRYYPHG